MGMSGSRGPADDAQSIATLHRAFDLGVNFLDTSASYGNGHNHDLIRRALEGRREKIIIHSKSGSPRTPNSRVDPDVPIEESVGGMARLVEQGKTRYIALSEASGESIRRANTVHPLASLQIEYSLWSRDAEAGNLDACREFGMGLMAYSPLGRGFLAGAYHDVAELPEGDNRREHPRHESGNMEHNVKLLGQLEEMAQDKGITPAQLALAWLLAQGDDVFPIPGIRTQPHLEENLKAIEVELTGDELAWIDRVMPPGAAAGPRARDMDRINV